MTRRESAVAWTDLDMLNVGAVVFRAGDTVLLGNPRLHVLHFAVELEQLLRLDEFPAPRGRQFHQLAVLGVDGRLPRVDVGRVEVAARHQTLAQ